MYIKVEDLQNPNARVYSYEELRALFDQWYEELLTTRQGKKQGADLRVKLLDVI